MKINCEKLTPKEKKDFIEKLKGFLKKSNVKFDGEIVRISDKAKISMGDYFMVCLLLDNYCVKVEIDK